MGRRTRAGKVAQAHQRRVDRWYTGLAMALTLLVVFPAFGVMIYASERFGTTSGDVFNSGTATVSDCSRRVLGAPYRCDVAVGWLHPGESPATVAVHALRPLTGTAEVVHRECGRPSSPGKKCPVFTADYPDLPGVVYFAFAVAFFSLLLAGLYLARRLAHRVVGPLELPST